MSNATPSTNRVASHHVHNRGLSLIELLVGIAIGLLVVLAALGTIVLNRTTGNTISDGAALTGQANNALRQIASAMRQAGALEPTLDDRSPAPVATEMHNALFVLAQTNDAQPTTIRCREGPGTCSINPETLIVSYLNRNPPGATTSSAVTRDCQGAGVITPSEQINNFFTLAGGELQCRSTTGRGLDAAATTGVNDLSANQPILNNVEVFLVRYLVDQGNNTLLWQRANAIQTAGTWNQVVAAEICLRVRGEVNHGTLMTGTYIDCDGTTQNHSQFLRLVVRQTVQLRNRGNNL
jgi:type IV pilus assembly protein PilW